MINTDVKIRGGGYVAEFRSDLGGNCYRLYHEATDSEILRTPETEEQRAREVFLFGNPILFPPNRIKGGEFEFEGRRYSFFINEPSTGCHLHGTLHKTPFEIIERTESSVSFLFTAGEGEYLGFPHSFRIKRSYSLGDEGLEEVIEVFNDSDMNMPFMLAFHTTFNAPFSKGACIDDCYLKVAVGREHIRDEKYIPTLEYKGGRQREIELNSADYKLSSAPLSAFYDNFDPCSYVIDRGAGLKIVYEASEEYKYRMLWRRDGAQFAVIEPQTCAIDCFHLEEPADKKGLITIAPKESIKLLTKMYVAKL